MAVSADLIEPFPHIVHDFYTDEKLRFDMGRIKILCRPNKLFDVEDYMVLLDIKTRSTPSRFGFIQVKMKVISNILEVTRKVFDKEF